MPPIVVFVVALMSALSLATAASAWTKFPDAAFPAFALVASVLGLAALLIDVMVKS